MMTATKPFRVHGRTFLPCVYQDSLDLGYRWYSVVTNSRTGLPYGEMSSPRFYTKASCRRWAACFPARGILA